VLQEFAVRSWNAATVKAGAGHVEWEDRSVPKDA
jgi:hypothetical protein